jgi:cytochrome b6-f complex iron-sulfur subunit
MAIKRKKKPNPDTSAPRRDFLSWLWVGLGLAAFAEVVWLAASFLRPSKDRTQKTSPETRLDVGPVDGFTPGTVTAFPRGRFYLARLADGGFLAISRRCPHLGCTIPWVAEEKKFLCPCHSSAFDIQGDVLRSPAPRAMDLYRVTIENAMVKVDVGRAIKRDRFQPEQVVYPEKV